MIDESRDETPQETIARLRARIHELEDFQQRVEANASEMIAMAEDLAIAKETVEQALAEKTAYEAQIKKLAMFDPLTGVANRNNFETHFEEALQYANRDGSNVALLLFDLDHFKEVNDNFGHPVGDQLLRYVAEQLKEATRETDTVARLGGDEFAIILTLLEREERASKVAQRIIDALSQPITLDSALIKTGTSIGISLYPRDGANEEELFRTADKALYASKSLGKGTYQFFDEEMEQESKAAHILENDMRLGIVRQEFILHYQPQVIPGNKDLVSVEALVRWNHPTRGMLMPGDFIEAAETSGLIRDLGKLVLDMACKQCKTWIDEGIKLVRVAVNVSTMQFRDAGFVEIVQGCLEKANLSPNHLELEITESLMMDNILQVSATLEALHQLGVSISVDDFGTGYSSLSYLKNLPIQKLKIDRSFIENLINSEDDSAITTAIINMGHSLNLQVVAEGIETEFQATELDSKGCDQLQGYLISKPLPAEDLAGWFKSKKD